MQEYETKPVIAHRRIEMIEYQLVAVGSGDRLAAKLHQPPRPRQASPDRLRMRSAQKPGGRECGIGQRAKDTAVILSRRRRRSRRRSAGGRPKDLLPDNNGWWRNHDASTWGVLRPSSAAPASPTQLRRLRMTATPILKKSASRSCRRSRRSSTSRASPSARALCWGRSRGRSRDRASRS